MKKIRLTERDLTRLIRRVINEQAKSGKFATRDNMKDCLDAGISDGECREGLRTGTTPPGTTPQARNGFWCCLFGWRCCDGTPWDKLINHDY